MRTWQVIKEVPVEVVRYIDREVIKEVPQIITQVVEKEVIKEVIKEVPQIQYVDREVVRYVTVDGRHVDEGLTTMPPPWAVPVVVQPNQQPNQQPNLQPNQLGHHHGCCTCGGEKKIEIVEKEIIKEVKVEVIKEVAKEVIKYVEVCTTPAPP